MSEFIANTTYGQVKGSKKVSVLRTEYLNFLGIPYAAAPIGELRFKDPIEPQKWQNVYDATVEKSRCYGMDQISKQVVGSEDCLFLNIFTKLLNPSKPFPVLVYIHGGAFNSGSSTTELYSPDYLLMADVIVVTLNYRVGPLGFMSFKDANLNVPGNAGMKDQVLALKFIKNNIQNFGGDPENITLIGHSAGGGSVSWHCLSELSKGLFHKAIIMSGCALNSWALTTQYEWPLRIAKALGFKGDEENESVLKFLREANPIEMVQVQKALVTPEIQGKVTFPFGPHIEPYMVHGETFIHVAPLEILKSSWANEIDILIGGTTDEGIMYLQAIKENPAILKFLKLENMVPSELNLSDNKRNEFVEILRQLYFPSSKPSEDKFGFCHMMTDKVFWHGMNRIVQGRQNYANGKTFLYRFAVDSPTQNHYKIARLEPNTPGVCHADELSYLFKDNLGDVPERETIEFKTIQRFVSVFTSFAISGNPNDNFINAQMQEVEWKAVDGCEPPFKCLNIEENLSFIELPEYERLEKWDQFYKSINAPLF